MNNRSLPFCVSLVIAFASSLLFVRAAEAHPFEIYSASPRISAMGGAGTAGSDDGYAAYFNPGALSTSKSPKLSAGFSGASHFFKTGADDLSHKVELPFHGALEASLLYPLPFKGVMQNRLSFGAVVSLPVKNFIKITKQDSNDIVFPFYNDRLHRLVFASALSVKFCRFFSMGAGVSLLPKVSADVDVNLSLENESIYNAAEISVGYSVAPIAGFMVMPIDWMKIGFSYRGGQEVDINLPIYVEDPPAHARIEIPAFSTPHEFSLGFHFAVPYSITILADATYSLYSRFKSAFPTISLLGSESGKVINSAGPDDDGYRDSFMVRLGGEMNFIETISVRLGGAYRRTPIPEQSGYDNIMDGDAFIVSSGLGLLVKGEREIFPADFRFDLGARLIMMKEVLSEKMVFAVDNPGFPRIRAGGQSVGFNFAVTALF